MSKAQASTSTAVNGPFQTKQEHALSSNVLKNARDSLESAGLYFSTMAISDAAVRARYDDGIRRLSGIVQEEVNAGRITPLEGAEFCQSTRNQIMEETRKVTSPWGLASAQNLKGEGVGLETILDRYSNRLFSKPFRLLTEAEKDRAYYAVIEAAGRSNAKVSAKTARLRVGGKVGILITGALAAYSIASADDKITETARQGTVVTGGMIGGALAGLAVSSVCGPGAPFCAIAVLIIGSSAAASLTDAAYDLYLEEVREFQAWGI
ncbi:hypothetical protein, partial [Caballeronia sp.]|uniref:hypothetical protein n=1 Tax=Caballeronia sp. TaxID=1931223 RepID=UPI003C3B8EC8